MKSRYREEGPKGTREALVVDWEGNVSEPTRDEERGKVQGYREHANGINMIRNYLKKRKER